MKTFHYVVMMINCHNLYILGRGEKRNVEIVTQLRAKRKKLKIISFKNVLQFVFNTLFLFVCLSHFFICSLFDFFWFVILYEKTNKIFSDIISYVKKIRPPLKLWNIIMPVQQQICVHHVPLNSYHRNFRNNHNTSRQDRSISFKPSSSNR